MGVLRAWRTFYGENPLHLLSMIGCFALVGYVVSFVYESPSALALAIWFIGAVLGHDLLLYPLYALADQPLTIGRWARRKVLPRHPPRVPAINHIRVPVLGAAVLGLIYFPTITQRGEDAFRFTAGLGMVGIYRNWLAITAVLFLGSAVVYALRLGASVGRTVVERVRQPALVGAGVGDADPAPDAAPEAAEPEPAVVEPEETETTGGSAAADAEDPGPDDTTARGTSGRSDAS